MSNQYIGEIRAFGFNFATINWAQCNGQIMAIDQNTTLFQILGTTYGGNGQTTFGLPNLQDLTPVGMGQGLGLRDWPIGSIFGEANHTLLINEVPVHTHAAAVAAAASTIETPQPTATSYPGEIGRTFVYAPTSTTSLAGSAISITGGSQPHPNIQPILVLNYCIALYGIYPSQG
jgi:microcystin-dependent protein